MKFPPLPGPVTRRAARSAVAAGLLALSLVLFSTPAPATPGEVGVGQRLRDVPMQGLNGPVRRFADFQGKPLIINVWASWCGPCRQEMGSLQRLERRYGGRQFNVIGISTDDYRDKALAFLRNSGTRFGNFIDANLVLEHMLGADRLPLTLLVDAQGRVLYKVYGAREWDSPEAVRAIGEAFGLRL